MVTDDFLRGFNEDQEDEPNWSTQENPTSKAVTHRADPDKFEMVTDDFGENSPNSEDAIDATARQLERELAEKKLTQVSTEAEEPEASVVSPTQASVRSNRNGSFGLAKSGSFGGDRGENSSDYEAEKERLKKALEEEQEKKKQAGWLDLLSLIGYSGDSTLPLNNATVLINALRNNPAQVAYEKHIAEETKARKQVNLHRMEEWAKENPVAASGISLVSKPISGVDYLNALIQSVAIGEVLPGGLPSLSETTQGLRKGASENMGKTGQFVYNSVMSAADGVIAGVLGNGSTGGGIILGFGTASDTANDIMDRGGTEEQALIGGAVSGILEGAFEKLSLGQLERMKALPADTVKNILSNIAKSVVTNAGEEFSTELANTLFDRVFMGELSTYELSVKSYISQGKTEAEARRLANQDLLERLCESAASGALIGVLFGGGASADSYYRSHIAAAGEARLRAGEMPTQKQLEAMNMSEPEARGKMVMLQMENVDGVTDINYNEQKTNITDTEFEKMLELAANDGKITLSEDMETFIADKSFSEIERLVGKLPNRAVRKWYLTHDTAIQTELDRTGTLEQRAQQAFYLRNLYRTQARDLMYDQEARAELDKTDPNKTFEELVADKMRRKGLTREEALEDIISTAGKTRKNINRALGLE